MQVPEPVDSRREAVTSSRYHRWSPGSVDQEAAARPRPPGPRVLVAFAGRHGAARETAATVAAELARARRSRSGLSVVLAPVEHRPDAVAFDAVVLGSEVHGGGRWLEPALHWVGEMSAQLRDRPVWLFSACDASPYPAWPRVGDGWWVADILGARAHRSFDGRPEEQPAPPAERVWWPAVVPGNHEDRAAVTDWSARIAAEIVDRPLVAGLR
jgi:menaquinone-dependent protoporphyrinogen oxidase